METCVLLSIKPDYASAIFDGSKHYEFRRKIFANPDIERVIVYASSPVKRVVGEFEIEHIIESEISSLWERTGRHSGICKSTFERYFNGTERGFAIKIKHAVKYDSPLELAADFEISHAPQFFVYLYHLPESILKNH